MYLIIILVILLNNLARLAQSKVVLGHYLLNVVDAILDVSERVLPDFSCLLVRRIWYSFHN